MQVFRELTIRGEPDQLAAAAEAIIASLSGNWSLDAEAEKRFRTDESNGARRPRGFLCRRQGRPATLFLVEKDDTTDTVSNIVPHGGGPLSHDEYNEFLEDFAHQFAEPAAARTGARVELTGSNVGLEHWLSADTARKLRGFSRVANRWSGSRHPADRERWYDFILSAHEEGARCDAEALARWLREEGGWDADRADTLAGEYQFARDLLARANLRTALAAL